MFFKPALAHHILVGIEKQAFCKLKIEKLLKYTISKIGKVGRPVC